MNYIENIYICLAAPLLIAVFCLKGRSRLMIMFILMGLTVCILSSYVSTFLAMVMEMDHVTASITIVPIVEETMKFLPILFYLLVFEPDLKEISACILMVACGFTILENVCYLIVNGTDVFYNLLIRGFGTGTMHIICALIIRELTIFWKYKWYNVVSTFGLLVSSFAYHGIYNMLVIQEGTIAVIGYLIPCISAILYKTYINSSE